MIPRDGAFLARILIWCQVPLENLTVCFDPNFSCSRRIDFLGSESWDTQPSCTDSFTIATDPFAPPFFDVLLGFPSASTCRKWHLPPCTQPFADLWFRHTGGCQNLHDGFWQNLNRHGISLLSNVFSCLLPDPCEDCWPSPSVCFAFEWDAGEDDRPFCLWPLCHCFEGLLDHDWNYMSLLPLKTLSHFPNVGFLSFLTLGDWSPFHNIVPNSGVSSSHHQINMKFLQLSPNVDSLAPCFAPFLDDTKPSLSCTKLRGSKIRFSCNTSRSVWVDSAISIYISGTGNISSWIDQKSARASASSVGSAGWDSPDSPWISPQIFNPHGRFRPYSGFSEFVVSSWQFCCTICFREYEILSLLSDQHFFRINSSRLNIWCIQLSQIFQICYQNISFSKFSRDQLMAQKDSW